MRCSTSAAPSTSCPAGALLAAAGSAPARAEGRAAAMALVDVAGWWGRALGARWGGCVAAAGLVGAPAQCDGEGGHHIVNSHIR